MRSIKLKILDRYIIQTMMPPLIFGVGIFACLFLIEQLVNEMNNLVQKQINPILIIKLLAYMLPSTLIFTIPMGVLMGTMIAFGSLSANSEITAFEAAGVSVRRLTRTAIIIGVLICFFVLFILQYVVPDTRTKMENVVKQMLFSRPTMLIIPGQFLQDIPGFSLYVENLNKSTNTATNVIYFQNINGVFPMVTVAQNMKMSSGEIALSNGMIYSMDNTGKANITGTFSSQVIPLGSFTANLNSSSVDNNAYYSLGELLERIKTTREGHGDSIPDQIMLQQYLAMSFSPIILIFLGTLLSIKNRRSGKGISFGFSLILIFIYLAMMQVGTMLALNRAVTPFLGMWYPNIVLIIFSIFLFIKQKKTR